MMTLTSQLNQIKDGIEALMTDAELFDVGKKEGMALSVSLRKRIQELRAPLAKVRDYIKNTKKEYDEIARFGSAQKKVEHFEQLKQKIEQQLNDARQQAAMTE